MVEKAISVIESFGFQATDSQCAIEAKPPVEWNKGRIFICTSPIDFYNNLLVCFIGRASIYILRTAFGVDWSERIKIIYAGDDDTDEDAMLVSFFSFMLCIETFLNIRSRFYI